MDRQIVYPGSIPLETDLLSGEKNGMLAIAAIANALFGTTTIGNGLACTPTSPASMQVKLAAGEIYQLKNVDDTAFSSLNADTAHQVMKQGINLDSVNLSCPAPATVGQSINYLIQATFTEADATSVVLPYYNASDPSTAYSGPANSGTPQPTVRKGTVTLTAKAGTSATTGTQTTPAADANNIGLWVVSVAHSDTSITSGAITAAAGAPLVPIGGILASIVATVFASRAEGAAGTNTTKSVSPDVLAQSVQNGGFAYAGAVGGTANALTAALVPAPASLYTGLRVIVIPGSNNTTAATLNLNALGVKNIKLGSSALAGGELVAGELAVLVYDGTQFQLLNPDARSLTSIPSGTKMLFIQTAAPTGWTKDTTHDNKALRVVSGVASSGGSVDFTSAFTSQAVGGTNGGYTLGVGDIPAHHHLEFNADSAATSGTTLTGANFSTWQRATGSSSNDYSIQGDGTAPTLGLTSDTGGGGSHTHSFSGTNIDLTVKYVDSIICTKN